jgi:large subunit ribosomal protein L3
LFVFVEGEFVDVQVYLKVKVFKGLCHGFVGCQATHGHNRLSASSVGASSYPSRVFKGMRMAGRMEENEKSSKP